MTTREAIAAFLDLIEDSSGLGHHSSVDPISPWYEFDAEVVALQEAAEDPLFDLTPSDLSAIAALARKKLRDQAARKLRSDFVPKPGHHDAALFHIEALIARAVALQEAAFRARCEHDKKNIRKQG